MSYQSLGFDLRHATRKSARWTLATVDAAGPNAGYTTAIAIDDVGAPHVVYHFEGAAHDTDLRYARVASGDEDTDCDGWPW